MPTTRQAAKLRQAEGIPPSPQYELPAELAGTQRRKKKAPISTRSTITPESDGDATTSHPAPAVALKEGNVGGYVDNSTREQEDPFLLLNALPQSQFLDSLSPSWNNDGYQPITEERRRSHIWNQISDVVQSPSPSPLSSPLFNPTGTSTPVNAENDMPVQNQLRSAQRSSSGASIAKLLDASTQTDMHSAPIHHQATTPALQASAYLRTKSAHAERPEKVWKSLGIYGFRSELAALPPDSCSVTLHTRSNREIRVSRVDLDTMHKLTDILHNRAFAYERNWLTSEEIAEQIREKSSSKRKRDDDLGATPTAQRRRIETSSIPTPPPFTTSTTSSSKTPTPKPANRASNFLRRRRRIGATQTVLSSTHPVFLDNGDPTADSAAVQYSQNGDLQLFAPESDNAEGDNAQSGRRDSDMVVSDDEIDLGENPLSQSLMTGAITSTHEQQQAAGTDPQQAQLNDHADEMPQTPQPSTWKLGSLFDTARKFIPSIRRQRLPLAVPQTGRALIRSEDVQALRSTKAGPTAVQTEPRQPTKKNDYRDTDVSSNFAQRLRDSQAASQRSFRSREKIDEIKKLKAEKERISAEWAALEEERRVTEKEKQDVEDAHRAAYAAQKTGTKRRIRASPRVIPNPKGVSYGLDPAYFDSDGSEDETETSPSRTPPRKIRRTESHSTVNEESQHATPAKGAATPSSGRATEYSGSRFSDSPPNVFDQSQARSTNDRHPDPFSISKDDPDFNHEGHFEVPWDSSSDEDDDEEDSEDVTMESPAAAQSPAKPVATEKGIVKNIFDSANATSAAGEQASQSLPSATSSGRSTDADQYRPSWMAAPSVAGPPGPISKPPATPGPTQGPESRKDSTASMTLERNRQMLRAQLEGMKGRKVLSPKDIQKSPNKAHMPATSLNARVTQPTPFGSISQELQKAPNQVNVANTGVQFTQPSTPQDTHHTAIAGAEPGVQNEVRKETQSGTEQSLTIKGAAGRAPSNSNARRHARALTNVSERIGEMQGYKTFQQETDPKVNDLIESSWTPADDEASATSFRTAYNEYNNSDQSEGDDQPAKTVPQKLATGPFIDDDDDDAEGDSAGSDDAPLYSSDENDAKASKASLMARLNTQSRDYATDPHVAAHLEMEWTSDDEAYASDEFKDRYPASKEAAADQGEPANPTNTL
ncbi:MAG: hypothetical protein Q9220_003174 [cf. Caloplaca sp. 1 TL-2023]